LLPKKISSGEHVPSEPYLAYYDHEECYVNLSGRYDYLETSYYASQDLECTGRNVHPTCKEILDAYVTPLFLEKAKLSGLAVPEYYITNGFFEPPVIIDTMNPFMVRSSIVLKAGHKNRVAKSMTRNYTYAICCQELPLTAQVKYFRLVLGWSNSRRFREIADSVWKVFHIPLARIRVIILESGEMLLSNVEHLPFERLNAKELAYLQEKVTWEE